MMRSERRISLYRPQIQAAPQPRSSLFDLLVPTSLAVVLAMVSLPLIAWSLDAADYSTPVGYGITPAPLGMMDVSRWSAAFGAVLAAAVVAGTLGGPLTRKNAPLGALVTVALAWLVGVAALPLLPLLLHANLGGNLGFARVCLDTCAPQIWSRDPGDGVRVLPFAWLGPLVAPVPFVTLLAGVGCWTYVLRRHL